MKAILAVMAALIGASPALAQAPPPLLAIYGVTVGGAGVVLRVAAGGCARKSDFTIAVLKRQPQSMVLLAAKRPADCGPVLPGHVDLAYSFDDLGLAPGESFVLANPLTAEPSR